MEKLKKLIGQAVRFGLVGIVNTLIDYGAANLLVLIPFFAEHYTLANGLGFLCGMGNSLVMNRKWTFGQKGKMTARQLLCFVTVNLAALGLSTLVLIFTKERLVLPFFIGKAVAAAASVGVNFLGSKLLVFRES